MRKVSRINQVEVASNTISIQVKSNVFIETVKVEKGVISLEEQYVDGTKIESKANKYTFVWKKTVEKNRAKLLEKTSAALAQIKEHI